MLFFNRRYSRKVLNRIILYIVLWLGFLVLLLVFSLMLLLLINVWKWKRHVSTHNRTPKARAYPIIHIRTSGQPWSLLTNSKVKPHPLISNQCFLTCVGQSPGSLLTNQHFTMIGRSKELVYFTGIGLPFDLPHFAF